MLRSLNVKAVVALTIVTSIWNVTSRINNISFTMVIGQVLDDTPLVNALSVGVPVSVIIFVPFRRTGL